MKFSLPALEIKISNSLQNFIEKKKNFVFAGNIFWTFVLGALCSLMSSKRWL